MVDTLPAAGKGGRAGGHGAVPGAIPSLAGDIRHLVPKLGLRNYWYPAIAARKVPKNRPLLVKMLGEDITFFRGSSGDPVAITDICPHRGARFSEGHVHWPGTVACPYHGWVYDENGKNVAVLSEGPSSKVCGKPGTEAKVYPTRTLKGVVFAWIGDTEPAPIQEDVPPEFFDPRAYITFNDHIYWPTNWLVALENSMDSHVSYMHRDNLQGLLGNPQGLPRGAAGAKPVFTGNGFRTGPGTVMNNAPQDTYANGWKWPKHNYRSGWWWLFSPVLSLLRVDAPSADDAWQAMGHRLPGMFRAGAPRPVGAPRARGLGLSLFGFYTRWPVATEPWKSRLWYFHHTQPRNGLERMWHKFLYNAVWRWLVEYNFSAQDGQFMFNQLYDAPEKLSGTDAEVIQWRKLIVTKAYGGRSAPFHYNRERDIVGIEEQPVSAPQTAYSFRRGG